jgi:hypothetical protein
MDGKQTSALHPKVRMVTATRRVQSGPWVGDNKGHNIMRKVLMKLAAASVLTIASAAIAAPASQGTSQGTVNNCWGVVSAQLAQVEGGIGDHASSQPTPRLGLGNVARLFYSLGYIESPTLSALGSFLASLDEYDETVCPVE